MINAKAAKERTISSEILNNRMTGFFFEKANKSVLEACELGYATTVVHMDISHTLADILQDSLKEMGYKVDQLPGSYTGVNIRLDWSKPNE